MIPRARRSERGQSTVETALSIPLLILLLGGMVLAAIYAFRSAATDWGVFITGVTAGTYNSPATEKAKASMVWPDIRARIETGEVGSRQVRSWISIQDSHPWVFGINLVEAQRATTYFRLWRFYPGRPAGDAE